MAVEPGDKTQLEPPADEAEAEDPGRRKKRRGMRVPSDDVPRPTPVAIVPQPVHVESEVEFDVDVEPPADDTGNGKSAAPEEAVDIDLELTPAPELIPPAPEPAPAPETAPETESTSETEPESASESASEPVPEPAPAVEAAPAPDPVPVPVPVPVPEPPAAEEELELNPAELEEEKPAPPSPPPAPPPKPAPPPPPPIAAVAAAVLEPRPKRRKNKAWFEEIFDEDYLRTLPFLTPHATQREAAALIEGLALKPGQQVLDVGCGYGRHAMELAARGFHVHALDLSLPLLLRGADEAQRRGLNINFVHSDMREMSYENQFDGVYCVFSTFGFFDDDTNKRVAQTMARALKPGGRLLLDILNRDYIIADLPTRVWWEGDGCVVLEEVDFNYFTSRLTCNRQIVFEDGRQLEQEISIRSYSLHEVGKLLHGAGFRVLQVSGGQAAKGRFFGKDSRQIIVIAEKRADPLREPTPSPDT